MLRDRLNAGSEFAWNGSVLGSIRLDEDEVTSSPAAVDATAGAAKEDDDSDAVVVVVVVVLVLAWL